MNALFPNALKKDKYITVLAAKYFLENESYEFTLEQIEAPIKFIVNSLECEINKCPDSCIETLIVKKCNLIFSNPSVINEDHLSQRLLAVFYYFISMKSCIKYTITNLAGVPFPGKHKEVYLNFISKMTRDVVNEILSCTLSPSLEAKKRKLDHQESPLQCETVFKNNNNHDSQRTQLKVTFSSSA